MSEQLDRKWFTLAMMARVLHICGSSDEFMAEGMAEIILRDYLKDSEIEFGDPMYDWSKAAADEIVEEAYRV